MKDGLFSHMKKQMLPDSSVEAALKYKISMSKKTGPAGYLVRWVPTAVSVAVCFLLILNMTMPAAAEQLPLVGSAFESLNRAGKKARDEGRTPAVFISEEDKEEAPFTLSASFCTCEGLDIELRLELFDKKGTISEKSDTVAILDCAIEVYDTLIYPTDEMPRLKRTKDGTFVGWTAFNASTVASLLPKDGQVDVKLYCRTLNAYVEGATYEESVSLYTYEFSYVSDITCETDLSGLKIEYLGIEKDGVTVEYRIIDGERTDYVYSVDKSVEYADDFSLFTDKAAPRVIYSLSNNEKDEKHRYCATFIEGEKDKCESEYDPFTKEDVYIDEMYENEDVERIIIYSHATGDYIILTEEEETE